jgi:hypothetical protein
MLTFRTNLFRSVSGVVSHCKNALPQRGMEEFFEPPPREGEAIIVTGRYP